MRDMNWLKIRLNHDSEPTRSNNAVVNDPEGTVDRNQIDPEGHGQTGNQQSSPETGGETADPNIVTTSTRRVPRDWGDNHNNTSTSNQSNWSYVSQWVA